MKNYLIVLHGIGLHRGYLRFVKEFFEKEGFGVKDPDLFGFGHSTSQNRGDIKSFHHYTSEVAALSQEIRRSDPESRIFVWGENIGATVALMYGIEYARCPRGIIAVNPMLSLELGFSKIKKLYYSILAQIKPDHKIELPFLLQDMTDDDHVATVIAQDEFVCTTITARFWLALSEACVFLWTDVRKMRVPFLIQYSKNSHFVLPRKLETFFAMAPVSMKFKEVVDGPLFLSLSREREELFRKGLSFIRLLEGAKTGN